ncbi:alpha/beta fold hydrolase [Mesorhizobium sp. ORM16]|uniref:alpha/beta fold hydrolase n=1 Tax=Mesorhizobium sp. ORM16 TaxID=3376989 RepID=UPI003857F272
MDFPLFAAAGIAVVRVDMGGSGRLARRRVYKRTSRYAVEIIAWIAAQAWSNGEVGMVGSSWGGGNSTRVAALKPPALTAVIAASCSIDRCSDALRYKGGAHCSTNLSRAASMLGGISLLPDPQIVSERWRDMWR